MDKAKAKRMAGAVKNLKAVQKKAGAGGMKMHKQLDALLKGVEAVHAKAGPPSPAQLKKLQTLVAQLETSVQAHKDTAGQISKAVNDIKTWHKL